MWLGCPALQDTVEEVLDPLHALQPVDAVDGLALAQVGGQQGAKGRGGQVGGGAGGRRWAAAGGGMHVEGVGARHWRARYEV